MPIDAASTSVTGFVARFEVGPIGVPKQVQSAAELASQFGEGTHGARAVQLFFANGGSSAWVVRAAGAPGPGPLVDGLVTLAAVHDLALLSVPDAAQMSSTDAAVVAAAAATYATARRAFYLMDPPASDPAELIGWFESHSTLRSPNAAAHAPRLLSASTAVAPSGAVAGLYARVDAARGVWKAPAGTDAAVVGIDGLEGSYDEATREALVAAGVNPLRESGAGHVVWGARTTAGAGGGAAESMYVPVRRLMLFLERSIDAGIRWAGFEPNGEPLWTRLRASVEQFLDGLWRRGALQGTTAKDAYSVACDRRTMTQADIDAGRIIVSVGVAPLRPAEFSIIRFELQAETG
jgi:phage tail sheath protein FI